MRNLCQFALALLLTAIVIPTLSAQGGPPGAIVVDIVVSPDSPNTMFVATNRGVFRSETSGDIWEPINDGLPTLNIRRIAGNQDILYAAAQEQGVFRFRDGGPWELAMNGLPAGSILSIETAPDNPNLAWAGTANGQICKSLDGADNWTNSSQGLAEGSYTDITVSPIDPQLLFASNLSAQSATGRLFRTTNGGTQWTELLSTQVVFGDSSFSPSTPGTAWVATSAGLIRTVDFGGAFTGPFRADLSIQDVAIDPTNSQIVYAGTLASGVVKSIDAGANWTAASTGLPRTTVRRVKATAGKLFAGLNGTGVYRSQDAGATWRLSSAGMHGATVLSVSMDPAPGGALLASTTGSGMFRSTSSGNVWNESRTGIASFQVTTLRHAAGAPGVVYGGTINPFQSADGSLLQSTDGGVNWQSLDTGFPIYSIATHPTDGNTVYVGTSTDQFGSAGLIRTKDRGETFEEVLGQNGELFFLDIYEIEIDPVDPRNVYIVVHDPFTFPDGYAFYFSNDEGVTWQVRALTDRPLTDIAVDPLNPARVFTGSSDGLFVSNDGGENFDAVTAGLPAPEGFFVESIAVDPNDNGAVYVSSTGGVFKSSDSGANWAASETGLDNSLAGKLTVDPNSGGTVYLATFGAGVYKTANAGESWEPTGGVPALSSAGVVNAATFQGGGVAPGEIVSIFVQNSGPTEGVQADFDPETGKLPTTLANVRVFFNDVPAPLFFVRFDQLNVQVPFEVAGLETVEVKVEYQGAVSSSVRVAVRATDPGVFAPVLNQDNSLNSEQNPAAPGSYLTLFATGQGLVNPALMSGAPAPAVEPLARPEADVQVLVNGQPAADIYFAGLTPNLVGLLQINVQLPPNISGRVEIQVFIGGSESPTRAIVYVQ